MNDYKSILFSKTAITGAVVAVAGALGLGGVVTPEVINAVVLVGGVLVVIFRKFATKKIA